MTVIYLGLCNSIPLLDFYFLSYFISFHIVTAEETLLYLSCHQNCKYHYKYLYVDQCWLRTYSKYKKYINIIKNFSFFILLYSAHLIQNSATIFECYYLFSYFLTLCFVFVTQLLHIKIAFTGIKFK